MKVFFYKRKMLENIRASHSLLNKSRNNLMSIKIERNRKMWYIGENAYDIAVKVNEVFYKMPWNIGTSQIEEWGKEARCRWLPCYCASEVTPENVFKLPLRLIGSLDEDGISRFWRYYSVFSQLWEIQCHSLCGFPFPPWKLLRSSLGP